MKSTVFTQHHIDAGAKMAEFAGYNMPIEFTGINDEHLCVRERAGVFDVSHMGELVFRGGDALAYLNKLLTNDFTNMYDGQVRYSPMCNEAGGCVDDLLVYKVREGHYLVVVNAANREKDAQWMAGQLFGDCAMEDISDGVAQLAIQGPRSREIMLRLVGEEALPKK